MKHWSAGTLKALRGSIEKWEGIVAGTTADHGPGNCPLCCKFGAKWTWTIEECCTGCPVAEFSGRPGCRNTPYTKYHRAKSPGNRLKQARAELRFLNSLLPKPKTPAKKKEKP